MVGGGAQGRFFDVGAVEFPDLRVLGFGVPDQCEHVTVNAGGFFQLVFGKIKLPDIPGYGGGFDFDSFWVSVGMKGLDVVAQSDIVTHGFDFGCKVPASRSLQVGDFGIVDGGFGFASELVSAFLVVQKVFRRFEGHRGSVARRRGFGRGGLCVPLQVNRCDCWVCTVQRREFGQHPAKGMGVDQLTPRMAIRRESVLYRTDAGEVFSIVFPGTKARKLERDSQLMEGYLEIRR